MYRHVYYDERIGDWSEPSTLYYQNTKGCFDISVGFPRCMQLRIPLGNAMVDKIDIAFSKGNDVWLLSETIDKYKPYNDSQQKWYEREIAELTGYSAADNSFDYLFVMISSVRS